VLSSLKKPLTVGTLLAAAALGLPGIATAATVGPVDLGTLPGDAFSTVNAINAGGTMVGESLPQDVRMRFHPVKWDSQGRISALPTLGGEQGRPVAVNDYGVAVGWAQDAQGDIHAVRWTPDGSVKQLPWAGSSDAAVISRTGVVAGGGSNPQSTYVALRWAPDGSVTQLASLPGGGQAIVTGITADGSLISGEAWDAAGNQHAVRWSATGAITDLSPGNQGNPGATAAAINDFGVVAGTVTEAGQHVPVAWKRDGRQVRLDWPAPPASATPRAINRAGVVVGSGEVDFAENRAVRWSASGVTVLQGARRSEAVAINDSGTAVGNVESVAARWAVDGTETILGALPGGDYSWATGIARDGTIIGRSDLDYGWHAVYWPAS
jgi:probable HAF family extracellular repeat protein